MFLDIAFLRGREWTSWPLPLNPGIPREQEEFSPFKGFPLSSGGGW